MKKNLNESSLSSFWLSSRRDYGETPKAAIKKLLLFYQHTFVKKDFPQKITRLYRHGRNLRTFTSLDFIFILLKVRSHSGLNSGSVAFCP